MNQIKSCKYIFNRKEEVERIIQKNKSRNFEVDPRILYKYIKVKT